MRRLLAAVFLASCTHTAKPSEVPVAAPNGTAPLVSPLGADARTEGVMGVAWSHPTAYKPWASAGDSILVLNDRAADIDIVEARSGRVRSVPVGEALGSLLETSGPMVLGT